VRVGPACEPRTSWRQPPQGNRRKGVGPSKARAIDFRLAGGYNTVAPRARGMEMTERGWVGGRAPQPIRGGLPFTTCQPLSFLVRFARTGY
jgi:hypothetical protein